MFNVIPEILYKLLSLLLPIFLCVSGSSYASLDYSAEAAAVREGADYTGLCEAYEDYFPVGAALNHWEFDNPETVAFIKKNFNMLVPEWQMKQIALNPHAPGTPCPYPNMICDDGWHFELMDPYAEFARETGVRLRGHTLVWPVMDCWILWTDDTHTQLVDKETLFARMETYIKTVMERYGDVIDVWDVVNEPFHYNWFAQLKEETDYFKIAGEEFIIKAFEYADKYSDANDILMVNETFVEGNAAKTSNMFCCVERWLKQGVRIDGVGSQGHMGTVSTLPFDPTFTAVDDLAKRCRKLGIKLEYTEIDVKVYEIARQRTAEIPEYLQAWQTNKYQQFFKALRRNSDVIIGATFWGLDDAHSVINYDTPEETWDWPMLFDKEGLPKQNFFAVCDF